MNNAEINYLSSESVCRLFSIEQDKGLAFINGYELRKERLKKEIERILSLSEKSSFNKRNFISTDETVAKIKGDLSGCKSDVAYKLKVIKLISCEELDTLPATKDKLNCEIKKAKNIEISIKSLNKELKIEIKLRKGDVYKDIIDDISNELNNAGFGLKSEVILGKRKESKKLHIVGKSGKQNSFVINIKGDEYLKSLFNVEPLKCASDYVYQLAGREYESASPEIQLNKNIKAKILKEGVTDIISIYDVDGVIKDTSKFVEKYNELIDYFIENKNYVVITKELKRYQESISQILYELSLLGIDVSLSGRLNVDKKKMKSKLIKESLYAKKYLEKDGGLLNKVLLLLKTSNISIDQIVHATEKKAYAMKIYERVNGKTMSHEPYYMIDQKNIGNLKTKS